MATPQRLHAELLSATASEARAYLLGALHDAHFNKLHRTIQFGQANEEWIESVKFLLHRLGHKAWSYRTGNRNFWVAETTAPWLRDEPTLETTDEVTAYVRGYFDTDGGMPHSPSARLYFQFVQKDIDDLGQLRHLLESIGISCGALHNPTRKVPDYWRFFVRAKSYRAFAERVGSWHPEKHRRLYERQLITAAG